MKKFALLMLFVSVLLALLPADAFAIPAFARKYNLSCQTCHSPFPKLKAYGETFAGDGFVLRDKEAPRYFLETGDPDLSLLREIPLSIRAEAYTTYNLNKSDKFDFSAPYILKLMSGGSIAKDVSYYFYFFFGERGEVAGVEDAFIMFNNLFSTEIDLYVGQFQASDPLFKRELRLTFEDYKVYKAKPGNSIGDLTYDRGIMLTYTLEKTNTDIIVEVLNGNGIGHANDFKIFDDDKYKNFLGRISQEITEGVRVGAFGYLGKEHIEDSQSRHFENSFSMWGPDLTLSYHDKLEFNFQYVTRTDDKPAFASKDVSTKGMFGELVYSPAGDESKWYGVAMYNKVESDDVSLNYESATLSLGYILKRNIRLVGEYTYNIGKEFGTFSIGVISAF